MNDERTDTLALYDLQGQGFGVIRFAPLEDDPDKGECIFDVAAEDDTQNARHEVRWICKRHFQRYSEHRFKFAPDGSLTISQGDFMLVLLPAEDDEGYVAKAPAPPITALWT